MIDLRYHVYSLAAVIVALAIGFVFGTSSVGKRADVNQVQRIAGRYERDLTALQAEMHDQQDGLRSAKADLGRSEKLAAALMPLAVKDKLLYRNVAIIQTGDYDDLTADVKAVVESAGAKVSSVTKIPVTFQIKDPAAVSSALSAAGIMQKPGESERMALLRTIADSVSDAKHKDVLALLADKQVVSISGDYARYNRCVVIVGGTTSDDAGRAGLVDVPLIERLEGTGATVVGCEPVSAAASYVPTWRRTNAATVDNVDTSCGRIALVCALAGESAHFGQKRTAERLLPETLGTGSGNSQ
jgi:hypothetical protein